MNEIRFESWKQTAKKKNWNKNSRLSDLFPDDEQWASSLLVFDDDVERDVDAVEEDALPETYKCTH
jgi:hypothetical protein